MEDNPAFPSSSARPDAVRTGKIFGGTQQENHMCLFELEVEATLPGAGP